MTKTDSILKNSFFLMGGNLLQRSLSLISVIIITRYLGPENYGKYTLVITLVMICSVVWNFGLKTVLIRDISINKSAASIYAGAAIMIKTLLCTIMLPLAYFYLYIFKYERYFMVATLLFFVGYFVSSITEIYKSIFTAYRRMGFSVIADIARSLTLILILGILVYTMGDSITLISIFIAYLISFVVANIISLMILKLYYVLPDFYIKKQFLKELIVKSFPFVLIVVADVVLFRIDHLMISMMTEISELGYYGAAYTIFEIVMSLFPMMFLNAAFPVLSDKYHNDRNEFENLCRTLRKILLYIGIPMSCGLAILGGDIVVLLYGETFSNAGILLSILGIPLWLLFLNFYQACILTAIMKQDIVLRATFLTMIANIILNIIFIPKYGAKGAALTTLICSIIHFGYLFVNLQRYIQFIYETYIIKIIISSIIMSVVIYLFKLKFVFLNNYLLVFFSIIIACITYFTVTFLLRTIFLNELSIIRRN